MFGIQITTGRMIWEFVHLWTGRVLVVLAYIQIGTGIEVIGYKDWVKITYAVLVVIVFIIFLIFEIRRWCGKGPKVV